MSKEIKIGIGELAYNLNCTPREKKLRPAHPIEAQFSIPYLIGVVVVERDVFIEHVTEDSYLFNGEIGEIAKRVKCYVDDEQEGSYKGIGSMGARVEITTETGQEYNKVVGVARGHYENPMTMNEISEKFRKCSLHAARHLREDDVVRMIDIFTHLEEYSDVSVISDLITGT